jgi:exodeoxyribonuclease-3
MGNEKLDQEGRLITIHFEDPQKQNEFVLMNCYFPNGSSGTERLAYKIEYYDEFLKYIEILKKSGKHIVFCGDVNTAHEEIDLSRPKENEKRSGYLPVEREWIGKLICKGYIDTFRSLHPEAIQYSWNIQQRIEHLQCRFDYYEY